MKYLRSIVFEKDWNGDHVRVEMEQLDRESFIRLWSMRKVAEDDVERFKATMEVLSAHVTSIAGLVDAAGVPITKEVVLSKVFFAGLVNDIAEALMEGSMLPKAKSDVSGERSPAGTEAPQ